MRRAALVCGVVGVAACDPELYTEQGQVRIGSNVHFESGKEILVESRVCARFEARRVGDHFEQADDPDIRACYEERLEGPVLRDPEGCLRLEEPARVTWSLDRHPCDLFGGFGDDHVAFEVVALEDVRGAFSFAVPMPSELLGMPIEATPVPAGYVAEVGEPIRVIAGTVTSVDTVVVRGDPVRQVAASDPQVTARVLAGTPTIEAGEEDRSTVGFEGEPGDAFALQLHVPAGDLDVGEVRIVARDEIASVEWAPMVVRVADTDAFLGLGAIAVARDVEGRVLRETPATWSVVDGPFALETFDFDEDGAPDPGDHASIEGACEDVPAGTRQSTTVRGRVDEFHGVVDVAWTCHEDHVADGCACGSVPTRGHGFSWVALLLALRRRDRHSVRYIQIVGSTRSNPTFA